MAPKSSTKTALPQPLDDAYKMDSITQQDFHHHLQQYPGVIPSKLRDLDQKRYQEIPTELSKRDPPSLSKDEVATLVDWKLAHGKFRPTLRALVQKNTEDEVTTTTKNAFTAYAASDKKAPDVKLAIASLAKLKGIGPATASLLLNVYDGKRVPFFSDELFRWAMYDKVVGKSPAAGWQREIKYNNDEYLTLYNAVVDFISAHPDYNASAVDLEMVGYVLAKQATNPELRTIVKAEAGEGQQQTPKDGKLPKGKSTAPESRLPKHQSDRDGVTVASKAEASGSGSRSGRKRKVDLDEEAGAQKKRK